MLTPTGVTVQNYISAINGDNPIHVRLVFSSQGITLDDQDIDISKRLVLEDIMNGDTDIAFGKAVMKQLTVGILNSNRVSSLVWTDEFDLEIGVDINGTTNYVKVGTFIGKQPQSINISKVINFTATDRMVKFDTLADEFFEAITYPTTVQDIYDDLCTFVGVTNVSGNELANIMSRSYAEAVFDMAGYTCRDILSWIAEACGCYAKINANGNVQMVWFTDHTSDVSIADSYEFDFDCADSNITAIDRLNIKQVGSDADVDYPDDTGVNTYRIINNPFLSVSDASDVTTYIKPIYDRLDAFGVYLPSMVRCVGNWLVETGDIIEADINGSTVSMPVFARTLVFNGNIEDTYEATGNKSRDVYASDSDKQKVLTAKQIELIVGDKYYERKSGITIDTNGVRIFGSNELRIESGGTFDVDSTNFKINSEDGYMKSGKWSFNDKGFKYYDRDEVKPFVIGKWSEREAYAPGIYYNFQLNPFLDVGMPILRFVAGGQNASINHEQVLQFFSHPPQDGHFAYGTFSSRSGRIYLGGHGQETFYGVGTNAIYGPWVNSADPREGTIRIYPNTLQLWADEDSSHEQHYLSGCVEINRYTPNGSSGDRLLRIRSGGNGYSLNFIGNLTGNVTGNVTGSASLNVLKAGDTMSGDLTISKAGDTYVKVINSNTSCGLYLRSEYNGTHGVWSSGYWNGSAFSGSQKWLIYRGTDGNVTVNGNCTGTAGGVAWSNVTGKPSIIPFLGSCSITQVKLSNSATATYTTTATAWYWVVCYAIDGSHGIKIGSVDITYISSMLIPIKTGITVTVKGTSAAGTYLYKVT